MIIGHPDCDILLQQQEETQVLLSDDFIFSDEAEEIITMH